MAHLKRLTSPKSWNISKKEYKFATRPSPGPHSLQSSIPLNLVVKNLLGYASTTRESKKIITSGKIIVDGRARKEHTYPLGVMDIIELPDTKSAFILLLDELGKFKLHPIKHTKTKYCKIIDKTTLRKKKTQLNLSSSRNIIIAKDTYKVGDTVLLDLSTNNIKSHLKFEKDATAYITDGKYVGSTGKILDITKSSLSKDKITIKIGNHKYETLKDYAFIVDKEFEEYKKDERNEEH